MKRIIKNIMHYFGLEVRRFSVKKTEEARLVAMLNAHNIDTVFDIGASVGLFGESLRRFGYKGRMVAFEPLTDSYKKLKERAKHDSLWDVAPRGAIGDHNGELSINIASNSTSSSLLSMLDSHIDAAPHSEYFSNEMTPVRTLDSVSEKYVNGNSKLFLKIDTQGYEHFVLEGGSQTLGMAKGIQIEMSLVPLYEGQMLYRDMFEKIRSLGFNLWGISTVLTNIDTGRLLQVDAVFFKD